MKLPPLNIQYVFDSLTDGLWDLDIKTDMVYLSPNASKLFGHVQPVTLSCKEVLDYSVHADFKDKIQDEIEKLLQNRIDIIDIEIIVRTSSKESRWIHLKGKAVSREADGSPNRLLGSVTDISKQKGLQHKITESEHFYRTLVNISPNGVVVIDLDGKLIFISKRTYQNFQVPECENHIGDSVYDWVAPDSHEMIKAYILEVLKSKKPSKSEEYIFLKHDKSVFWAELSSSPLLDYSGKVIGLMIVGHDITERKKFEEDLVAAKNKAEESDKLKTAFINNISHEIRTPLNAIVGFSSLLDDQSLSIDKTRLYIEIISRSSDHLLEIIGDILVISNIEAGIVNVEENDLDINELIENLYWQFNLISIEKHIHLRRSVGIEEEKFIIRSDRTILVKIISNLLYNALKFTDSGVIEFGYRVIEINIEFYVSDTGKGIPEEEFHKVFDRFYQVQNSGTRLNEGTGLGLSICQAYVKLLGGTIWLTSKVGEGTTFYFTIPNMSKLPLPSGFKPVP